VEGWGAVREVVEGAWVEFVDVAMEVRRTAK
jgi:hypothetical protein